MPEPLNVRAAQYLRMSTEHQRYSLENQAAAIAEYAAARGYDLARSYLDPGKSGLTLQGRRGLQALLSDALRPDRGFDAILVLDVSRWGRFQDLDQSAHYEFICRQAGVEVVYCAEPFENDASPMGSIVKQIKRVMAAEYSRELSEKIIRAQLRLARLGFFQGGPRVYGVDRLVIDARGRRRFGPGSGDRKAIATDRVILVPGPEHELAVIRRIYRRFVVDRLSMSAIAADLNARGVLTAQNTAWNRDLIRRVLTNELMIGVYVFNRTRSRLSTRRRANPADLWVRVKVIEPLISPGLFARAARLLGPYPRETHDRAQMLRALKTLLRERGFLTMRLIETCPYTPVADTYIKYFGSITAAYAMIGYVPKRRRRGPVERDSACPADEDLLRLLQQAFERHGRLSADRIDEDGELPSSHLYRRRFGSLACAYERAGLPHTRSDLARLSHTRCGAADQLGLEAASPAGVYSRDHLLRVLREIHARQGYVSVNALKADRSLPPYSAYKRTFGSILKAYALAGLPADLDQLYRAGAERRDLRRPARRFV